MKKQSLFTLFVGTLVGVLATVESALAEPCGSFPLPACTVPEPSSLPLVVAGIAGVAVVARFFKKK